MLQLGTPESVITSPATFNYKDIANTLTPEQVSNILLVEPQAKKIFSSVREYAMHAAINLGVEFPGMKVVEGRSSRSMKAGLTPEIVAKELRILGMKNPYKEPEIKNLGDIEKELGTGKIGHLFVKRSGRPTLVSADSPKPKLEVTNTIDMFDVINKEEEG
jgi:hypothetical protein